MEKEILEILKAMQDDIRTIKSDIIDLRQGQNRIENKLDSVVEQTADLTEFRTEMKDFTIKINYQMEEMKDDFDSMKIITANNWKDITKLKSI